MSRDNRKHKPAQHAGQLEEEEGVEKIQMEGSTRCAPEEHHRASQSERVSC